MSPTDGQRIDAAGAAHLLEAGAAASARADAAVDHRVLARTQFGIAAAMFIYLSVFLLLFGNQTQEAVSGAGPGGYAYGTMLLIPFLVLTQLVMGVRDRVGVVRAHRPYLVSALIGLIPFLLLAGLSVLDVSYPWGLNLVAAAAPAVPLAGLGLKAARRAGPRSRPVAPIEPGRPARIMTASLGLYLGLTGMLATFSWSALTGLALVIGLVILLALISSRWGLPSLGAVWGSREWAAYGTSFTLLVTLAVVLARTPWNTPLVGVVGGLIVAAPLVVAAVRGARS
ncbi:hypothetical protein [Cryobacterium sp. PH31-L1]|uniref:hypothetical protein n=1 Tax=Cryobacterium sp. PH31-L1 TaxID=3046199 RepID=UPI0024B94AF5|nr:hypothetical protein [Cryobacterium sp. PH31-L1]MDJ0376318.1 hypothetical protein [Cryobacterium sp. PH31-L1]